MTINASDDTERIVITGMGVITSNARSTSDFVRVLQEGISGITCWHNENPKILSKIGGDLSQFTLQEHLAKFGKLYPKEYISKASKLLKISTFTNQATTIAALDAFISAGLERSNFDPQRIGHILAGHNLNGNYIYKNTEEFLIEPDYIDGLYGMLSLDTDILALISDLLNIHANSSLVGGACASGNLALISALDNIRANRADVMLVTGAASDLDPILLQGLSIIQSLSIKSFNQEPTRASRPFDALREGFVPAHGAGCIVLERYSHAKKRGVPILAELLGGGATSDACHSTRPDMQGQLLAMQLALQDAKINSEQINYISAHATSSVIGDKTEVDAIKMCFKEHAYSIKVNATKSITGHFLYSSGIIEFIATILQLNNNFVHATLNQEVKDPGLDLDFVPNHSQEYNFNYALSNAFGFGGLNSSIIIGRYK